MDRKQLKELPHFQSEDEEREFWSTHEIQDYFDVSSAIVLDEPDVFSNLKLSEDLIEFTMPEEEVEKLKTVAARYHLTQHALARKFVLDALKREKRPSA